MESVEKTERRRMMELSEEIRMARVCVLENEDCFDDDGLIADKLEMIIFCDDPVSIHVILQEIQFRGAEGYKYIREKFLIRNDKLIFDWVRRIEGRTKTSFINFLIRHYKKAEEQWVQELVSYMTEKEINESTKDEMLPLITTIKLDKEEMMEYLVKKGALLNIKCKCSGIRPVDIYSERGKTAVEVDYVFLAKQYFKRMKEVYEFTFGNIFEMDPLQKIEIHKDIWDKYILIAGIDLIFDEEVLFERMVSAKIKREKYYRQYIKEGIRIGEVGRFTVGIIPAGVKQLSLYEYVVSEDIHEKKYEIPLLSRVHENFEKTVNRIYGKKHGFCIYASSKIKEQKKKEEEEQTVDYKAILDEEGENYEYNR